jgi:hypothetical protein
MTRLDKISAMRRLHETARRGEFATGLIYIEPDRDDFHAAEPCRRAARDAPPWTARPEALEETWKALIDFGELLSW